MTVLTQRTLSFNLEMIEKTIGQESIYKIEMNFIIPLKITID